ncbi:potassium channel family protein [Nocardioides sp. SOB77]|uniref:Potassium channel family protein n=1 Tax=Nocardioides oceani TaxID=3058369 RepID=A0ABT8FEV1_9ACTN|nr:potassium channel family protein [Nocardioides oceani]MDN4173213.1 potassium channel family protein [Nocardioides oceani]
MTAAPGSDPADDRADARAAARLARPARRLVNHPWLLVAAILSTWVGCSLAYAALEDKGPVESLWWGVVTGSTVGYGDSYPASTAGRAVAVVLIVAMLVLVPIAIGHVIAGLVHDRDQFSHDEQVALAETIESLHDRVELLQHLLVDSLADAHGEEWLRERLGEHRHGAVPDDVTAADDVDDRMLRLFRAERP